MNPTETQSQPTTHNKLFHKPLYIITLAILVIVLGWLMLKLSGKDLSTLSATTTNDTPAKITPDPLLYKELIAQTQKRQQELAKAYQAANTSRKKQEVIDTSRAYIESTMPKLMKCWIGTPWDFNGTSQTPGEGKIACGYFVSVVLRDMGFKVSRISLAQQPSQNIIRTMIKSDEKKIMRYDLAYDEFVKQFKKMPDGIYIIGLDSHVGFLSNFDDEVRFIHSGAYGVINEQHNDATDVKISRYRVVGNVTGKDYVIEKWLKGIAFPTKK